MQNVVTLDQTEIESALKDYVSARNIDLNGKTVEVILNVGRGTNPTTATMAISNPVINAGEPTTVSSDKDPVDHTTNDQQEKSSESADDSAGDAEGTDEGDNESLFGKD